MQVPIVQITWHDPAFASGSWMTAIEVAQNVRRSFTPCQTVGYEIYKDDKRIVLAASVANFKTMAEVSVVARNACNSRQILGKTEIDDAMIADFAKAMAEQLQECNDAMQYSVAVSKGEWDLEAK